MSRIRRPPSYRLHKARGLAVVTLDGKNRYLGPFGSPESHEKYARLIAEWQSSPERPTSSPSASDDCVHLTVNEVIDRYWSFAIGYYLKHGERTGECDNIRLALSHLRRLYGRADAGSFTVGNLDAVRQAMIQSDLSRKVVNARIGRIRRMFRWASCKSLVPPATYHALTALDGLRRGRSQARETQPVRTVAADVVESVLPYVTRQIRAMIQVQELAGMRPQDVRNMRTADVEVNDGVWVYRPWTHKTEHHGHSRQIAIGPRAQSILKPFLKPDRPQEYLFSPKEAIMEFRAELRLKRESRPAPSERRRPKRNPKRSPGNRYGKNAYEGAIRRACDKAAVARWCPNQLRHNCATRVRRLYGLDGAAAVLGHRLGTVTEVYAEAHFQKAIDIMREIG